jgi:hypothetical protein
MQIDMHTHRFLDPDTGRHTPYTGYPENPDPENLDREPKYPTPRTRQNPCRDTNIGELCWKGGVEMVRKKTGQKRSGIMLTLTTTPLEFVIAKNQSDDRNWVMQ